MSKVTSKRAKRQRRKKRVRAKVKGTLAIPRLSLFRSNRHVWAQLIDDTNAKTLISASSLEAKEKSKGKMKNVELAYKTGELIANKASEKKIKAVVFDRGGYKYHGIVKAVAEGARRGGLKF